jgi:hypothetical protein
LLGIVDRLDAKGVALHDIMSMGGGALDTGEPTGRMMLTVLNEDRWAAWDRPRLNRVLKERERA